MHILALLTDPGVVRPILQNLRIPEHPPPGAPARGPPQTELLAHDPLPPGSAGGVKAAPVRFLRCDVNGDRIGTRSSAPRRRLPPPLVRA